MNPDSWADTILLAVGVIFICCQAMLAIYGMHRYLMVGLYYRHRRRPDPGQGRFAIRFRFQSQGLGVGRFHHPSQVHDHNPIADMFDDPEIMANMKRMTAISERFAHTGPGRAEVAVLADAESIVAHLAAQAAPGDVVLCMSNGGFDNIHARLLEALL